MSAAGCKVCSHPMRRKLERLWINGRPARYLSERVRTLSRPQLDRHFDMCPLLDDVREELFRKLVDEQLDKLGEIMEREIEESEGSGG
jgi:hypothetical protein